MTHIAVRCFLASLIFSWLSGLSIIVGAAIGREDEDNFFIRLCVGLFVLAIGSAAVGIFFLFVGMLDLLRTL